MTSRNRVHYWIVVVGESAAATVRTDDRNRRATDPFICDLIARLQAEVRQERASRSRKIDSRLPSCRFGRAVPGAPARHFEQAEAEITWRESPLQFTEPDFDAWERGSVPPIR